MAKLNLDRQESEFLNKTITHWEEQQLVDNTKANELRNSYEVKGFDWMRLAKYSFWIALICGIVAVGSLIVDDTVLNYIKRLYDTPDIVISLVCGAMAGIFFSVGREREKRYPENIFSNEAVIFTGVLFTACCIAYLGKTFDKSSGHYSLLFLLSVFIYGILAWRMRSRLIWLFALVSLGSWFGTETGYQTNWAFYFLGMNYPIRFVLFGLVLVSACYVLRRQKWFGYFWELTYVVGLLYLFMSLWLMSIFGNYGSLDTVAYPADQPVLLGHHICGGGRRIPVFGLKYKDVIAREFGITFLIIFLYTKYFEYFWDHTNKTLFFAILGLSFWLIGRKAEKIWNLNTKNTALATGNNVGLKDSENA